MDLFFYVGGFPIRIYAILVSSENYFQSQQQQQSILTLATHLLLTIPVITQQQSWDIIRETTSHRHTLQLILATVTLQRHHLVWHTVMTNPPATLNLHLMPTATLSHKPKRRAVLNPKHRSPKRQRHTRS